MSNNSDESRTPEALWARFEPHLMETFHDVCCLRKGAYDSMPPPNWNVMPGA